MVYKKITMTMFSRLHFIANKTMWIEKLQEDTEISKSLKFEFDFRLPFKSVCAIMSKQYIFV